PGFGELPECLGSLRGWQAARRAPLRTRDEDDVVPAGLVGPRPQGRTRDPGLRRGRMTGAHNGQNSPRVFAVGGDPDVLAFVMEEVAACGIAIEGVTIDRLSTIE